MIITELINRFRSRKEFITFGAIGTAAFVVDAAILYLVKGILGIYWGRGLSFFCAVIFTLILNRNFTFRKRWSGKTMFSEFGQYLIVMLGGGVLNYL